MTEIAVDAPAIARLSPRMLKVLRRRSLSLYRGAPPYPFAVAVPTPFAYYVVCPQATAERPKVAAFRAWLRAEAVRDPAPAA